ncbi:hypothetical protein [Nonomuraea guangzhouensis]|uniref:Uncharacterized protein n=1 Tax=Nonomuraea guangzhouensis TaxID=1291555 RepID=A0ABW4GY29_9ACTN|nr:hypothetical protein [Nonomuraea guangzhouensis]
MIGVSGATAAVPNVTAQLPGGGALGLWIVLACNGLRRSLTDGGRDSGPYRPRWSIAVGNVVDGDGDQNGGT